MKCGGRAGERKGGRRREWEGNDGWKSEMGRETEGGGLVLRGWRGRGRKGAEERADGMVEEGIGRRKRRGEKRGKSKGEKEEEGQRLSLIHI